MFIDNLLFYDKLCIYTIGTIGTIILVNKFVKNMQTKYIDNEMQTDNIIDEDDLINNIIFGIGIQSENDCENDCENDKILMFDKSVQCDFDILAFEDNEELDNMELNNEELNNEELNKNNKYIFMKWF